MSNPKINAVARENGAENFAVKASMAALNGHYKLAETIYLEQGQTEAAMTMYQVRSADWCMDGVVPVEKEYERARRREGEKARKRGTYTEELERESERPKEEE